MVSGEYQTVRDMALAERNHNNWLRWADAWARGDSPRDLRSWQQKDAACDIHARANYLQRIARKLHSARFGAPKVVNLKAFRMARL